MICVEYDASGVSVVFFFGGCGDHRDLHVLTHSFPPRRSSGLRSPAGPARRAALRPAQGFSTRCNRATANRRRGPSPRSEEHTSELQSLMRISYAVFCLKEKNREPNSITGMINYLDDTLFCLWDYEKTDGHWTPHRCTEH